MVPTQPSLDYPTGVFLGMDFAGFLLQTDVGNVAPFSRGNPPGSLQPMLGPVGRLGFTSLIAFPWPD